VADARCLLRTHQKRFPFSHGASGQRTAIQL
jgi:hypothetical protein